MSELRIDTVSPATAPPIILLGAATVLASLAIQMFVPAMPVVAREMGASIAALQFSVTVYLIGMGIGQLSVGPLADRRGSRSVLLVGLLVFATGSIGAGLANNIPLLLTARLIQSLGGAATVVTGRSLIAETASGAAMTNHMAGLMTVTLLSPVAAPAIGGYLAASIGWRYIFWLLAGSSALIAVMIATRTTHYRPPAVFLAAGPGKPRHPYKLLLSNSLFVRLLIGNAGLTVGLYVFLTTSPFLLNNLNLGARAVSQCLLLVALSLVVGTLCVRYHAIKFHALLLSRLVSVGGGVLMLVLAVLQPGHPSSLIGPMCLVGWATGVCTPVVMSRALLIDRARASSASSLFAASQTLLIALATAVVIGIHIDSLSGVAIAELVCLGASQMLLPRDEAAVKPIPVSRERSSRV